MPIKHNLTRYDMLKDQVHRLASKNEQLYTSSDRALKDMATIVAAFSSGQSWRTHSEVFLRGTSDLSSQEIREEYAAAAAQKWKTVSSFDIGEVVEKGVSDDRFRRWLYYNVPRAKHEAYCIAWNELNKKVERDGGIEELVSGAK